MLKLWIALLVLSSGVALWFVSVAGIGIWKYISLSKQAPATLTQVEVCELSSSRFAVVAQFYYTVGQETCHGKTIFERPQFMNHFAAEHYAKLLSGKVWKAWYQPSHPCIASLERHFPQKACLHALLTLGVFIYFYFAKGLLARLA